MINVSVPTLRDVAALAGVHPATASRALNPATKGMTSADTAQRVLQAAEQLGYRPNAVARSLRTARSSSIGVVVPDLTNPLFPPIVRGIEANPTISPFTNGKRSQKSHHHNLTVRPYNFSPFTFPPTPRPAFPLTPPPPNLLPLVLLNLAPHLFFHLYPLL